MLKKLRSRRGFTIVEVMVAFVIFAIMAAMVSAILQQTMLAKQENTDLEDEIKNQENVYYRSKQVKNGEYDSSDQHTVTMDFVDKTGNSVVTIPLDYSIGDPNPDDADNQITLNYIQGDLNYSTEPNKANPENPGNTGEDGGSVHSRLNSYIYGSSDISSISMYMVKAPDSESSGKNRYYISLQVNASALMTDFYKSFAKINFDLPSGVSVVSCGKISSKKTASTEKPYEFSLLTSPKAGYEVTTPTRGTLRIASTVHKDDGSGCILSTSFGEFGIYVDLSKQLDASYMNGDSANSVDLNKLFGYSDDAKTSNKNSNNYYVFTPYVGKTYDSKGNVIDENGTFPNVFAGSQK